MSKGTLNKIFPATRGIAEGAYHVSYLGVGGGETSL